MFSDFINLLFPNQCRACGSNLLHGENIICTFCLYHLPKTNYHFYNENPIVKHFWGKVFVQHATAYYYFHKGEKVQSLIHALKYKGEKDVGIKIGNLCGSEIKVVDQYAKSDYIIPVPLHPSRFRLRGFNQAELFAQGIGQAMNKEIDTKLLIRKTATETQTRKHRFNRYQNMKEVFDLINPTHYANKTFLLVDDVITTGSTLASCAEILLSIPGAQVNIAAMAYAHR